MQMKLCRKQIPDKSSAHYPDKQPLHLRLRAQRAAALVQLQRVCSAACPEALNRCCVRRIFLPRHLLLFFPFKPPEPKNLISKDKHHISISDQHLVQLNVGLK